MASRMRLRRDDGQVYLNRWGFEHDRIGGIFLHKMEAPDPGLELHDHPWWFVSLILKGGYWEEREDVLDACAWAKHAEEASIIDHEGVVHPAPRGIRNLRRPWSVKTLNMKTCHRITRLLQVTSWSIIVHGPKRTDRPKGAKWGFYMSDGWVGGQDFRTENRELWNDLA